ncbi:hypothetical protein FKM82_018602 [Ascaphus truei]
MTEYLTSLGNSFRLMNSMGCSTPSNCWDSPAPSPTSEASVWMMKGSLKSGLRRAGPSERHFLSVSKASWHSQDHLTWVGALFFVRSVRGAEISEKLGINRL